MLSPSQCACGGICPRCKNNPLQAKIAISEPGDTFEREADLVARQVMSGSDSTARPHFIKTAPSSPVGRSVSSWSPVVENAGPVMSALVPQDSGLPLAPAERTFFETRMGHDFSEARVHTGGQAEAAARSVGARAFTLGNDIVFNQGEYAPNTKEGRHLIAHELAHLQQQRQTPALARKVMRACDKKTTGVDDAEAKLDQARASARSAVKTARAAFKPLKTFTLKLLDRHFHCPSNTQIIEAKKVLTNIEGAIPAVTANCLAGAHAKCAGGSFGFASDAIAELNTCPPWFTKMTDVQQAVTFIFAAATGIGRSSRCRRSEACYDDYTRKAATMLYNPYSYAWFSVEAANLSPPDGGVIPCRPMNVGIWVVVPPEALKDPGKIFRLTGYDSIPKDSEIIEVHTDVSNKDFIYHDKIEGAKQYLSDETKRYYFPGGEGP